MKHISVKCNDNLLQDVNVYLPTSRFQNKSELVRALLRDWVDSQRKQRRSP